MNVADVSSFGSSLDFPFQVLLQLIMTSGAAQRKYKSTFLLYTSSKTPKQGPQIKKSSTFSDIKYIYFILIYQDFPPADHISSSGLSQCDLARNSRSCPSSSPALIILNSCSPFPPIHNALIGWWEWRTFVQDYKNQRF